ncbi:hypothetical protein ABVT39_008191 [Epinephelus coioides]
MSLSPHCTGPAGDTGRRLCRETLRRLSGCRSDQHALHRDGCKRMIAGFGQCTLLLAIYFCHSEYRTSSPSYITIIRARDGYGEAVLNWNQFLIGQYKNIDKFLDTCCCYQYLCSIILFQHSWYFQIPNHLLMMTNRPFSGEYA